MARVSGNIRFVTKRRRLADAGGGEKLGAVREKRGCRLEKLFQNFANPARCWTRSRGGYAAVLAQVAYRFCSLRGNF